MARPSDSQLPDVLRGPRSERLGDLIAAGEGLKVEFKVQLPPGDRILFTLCAFANTRGGTLLVGVTDAGRLRGVERPREVSQRLADLLQHRCTPPVQARIEVADVEDVQLVVCTVPESDRRPHSVIGEASPQTIPMRVGASNRRVSEKDLRPLERSSGRESRLSELERTALEWVRANAGRSAPPDGSATVARFAREYNLGASRARRSFEHLLRDGLLVAHGRGARRFFAPS